MTRTMTRRPLTPISSMIRLRHGHKRKGKPVDKDLQHQDENFSDDNLLSIPPGVNLNAIEQIANGVERMMCSWHLDTFERGRKQAKIIFTATNHPVHSSDSQQVTTTDVAPGPIRLTHEKNVYCSIVETLAQNTDGIAACEKSVGTEARECHQKRTITNNVVMTESSPGMLTPSVDASTLHERNCYHVKENSCPNQSPVAEHQLQFSPRKEEPHAVGDVFLGSVDTTGKKKDMDYTANGMAKYIEAVGPRNVVQVCTDNASASTLTHFGHSQNTEHAETDTKVEKATYIDVVAGVVEAHNLNNHGSNSGAISHSSSYYWPCHIETLEVGGRLVTMPALRNGTEALRNKFESLINITSGAPLIQVFGHFLVHIFYGTLMEFYGNERPCSVPPEISSVEELQLALIECATEFEIQTLDARMKVHGMRAQQRQITSCEFDQPANSDQNQNIVREMMSTSSGTKISQYALQQIRREVMKPEKLKDAIIKSGPQPWKKKERLCPELKKSEGGLRAFLRLFDRQRRNLDDALNHVDRLQREVLKKDRELVEWQLKEKETKTQMHELEDKVKRTRLPPTSPRLEPRKLFLALPVLRESLRSLKAEEQKQIRSPLAEASQELANMENKSMSDRDCSLNTKLQCLEERTSEMDELKVTMSKLASNMADLSMAFKDHVQFVNHRLGAIHTYVMKRNIHATSPELVPSYVSNRNAVD